MKHGNTFEAIFFLLPNGDMYMEEPYELQLDLTRNNFAFRDYYKGAIETKQPFLGDAIVSAATGERIVCYLYSNIHGEGQVPVRDMERRIES